MSAIPASGSLRPTRPQPSTASSLPPDEGRTASGLGLALVRSFVELHGGRVEMDSAVGRGRGLPVISRVVMLTSQVSVAQLKPQVDPRRIDPARAARARRAPGATGNLQCWSCLLLVLALGHADRQPVMRIRNADLAGQAAAGLDAFTRNPASSFPFPASARSCESQVLST
jgi:hypothetical protein